MEKHTHTEFQLDIRIKKIIRVYLSLGRERERKRESRYVREKWLSPTDRDNLLLILFNAINITNITRSLSRSKG